MVSYTPNPARRVTIAEILESSHVFTVQGDGDNKPSKYALLPTGERANGVFLIATLKEAKVDEKNAIGTIYDKTGKIRIRASSEYQPSAYDQIRRLVKNLPAHIAISGRINVYEPEKKEGENTPDRFISIQPEGISHIEREYRDLWNEDALQETVRRAESWNPDALTEDQEMAREIYGHELKDTILQKVKAAYQGAGTV
jgi:RPA family protein